MTQPGGFIVPGHEHVVFKLIKCVYGFQKASRICDTKLNEFLMAFRLNWSEADPCVYYRCQGGEMTILAIFVDDGLVCSNKKETPADPHTLLSAAMLSSTEEENEEMRKAPYHEAVGSLIYLAATTRPDIKVVVRQVSQFCQKPGGTLDRHWYAVKRIQAYLKRTLNFGLRFGSDNITPITFNCDADYARDLDKRHSSQKLHLRVYLLHIQRMNHMDQLATNVYSSIHYRSGIHRRLGDIQGRSLDYPSRI